MDSSVVIAPRNGSMTSLWLFVTLLFSLLIIPLFEGLLAGRALLLIGLTLTFVVGVLAARGLRFVLAILLVVAIPVSWATLFSEWKVLFVAHCLLGSAFFWMVGGGIVLVVVRSRAVTLDSVFGAISAYLLFGLAWALSFWAIHAVTPAAFSFPANQSSTGGVVAIQQADFSQFIYYSFVTMSTLGYGDITPLGPITRTLSWVQSITGQFYVAVVIAWLVSALPQPGRDKN
jgi:hypothetical protein